jgi:hypothetical protein
MASPLTSALTDLRDALASVRLPLPLPHAAELTGVSRDSAKQLDDYVLPRLSRIEAPLLAVVGGSTGAGKSTLVNSLIGRVVTKPGVIRPTTRSPVLVYHPDDARWFTDERILPGLLRSSSSSDDTRSLHLVPNRRCRMAWPCWTRPTSTRSSSRTAASPRSCCRPPTCGCS